MKKHFEPGMAFVSPRRRYTAPPKETCTNCAKTCKKDGDGWCISHVHSDPYKRIQAATIGLPRISQDD